MVLKENERIKNPFKRLALHVRKSYSAMERKDFGFVALLLAFPVIHVLVFYFYVNISSITMAFQDAATGRLTLENIKTVLTAFIDNEDIWGNQITTMLGKSVFTWTFGKFVTTPLGWLTCYFLTKHIPGSNFFRAMYSVPTLVGVVVMTTIYKDFFAHDGIITQLLLNLGAEFPIQVIRNGLLGHESTAFMTLWLNGFIVNIAGGGLILAGAYMRIPNELFESAHLDGCGFFRETFSIAIPCVWTTISTMMIFNFCGIFTYDGINAYIYSNGSGAFGINNMGYYLYSLTANIASGADIYVYHYLSALGIIITLVTAPLVLLGKYIMSKINDDVTY